MVRRVGGANILKANIIKAIQRDVYANAAVECTCISRECSKDLIVYLRVPMITTASVLNLVLSTVD